MKIAEKKAAEIEKDLKEWLDFYKKI